MKFKNAVLKAIAIIFVFAIIASLSSNVKASTDKPSKILNIKLDQRPSGLWYLADYDGWDGNHSFYPWKIYEYESNGTTIKNRNNGIYCLRMGIGFGSDSSNITTTNKTYNAYADMKSPTETDYTNIISKYKTIIGAETNYDRYDAIVWILDNSYVPAKNPNPTDEQIKIANMSKQLLIDNVKKYDSELDISGLSDDVIDIIQQAAIWHFSNNGTAYNVNSILLHYGNIGSEPNQSFNISTNMTISSLYGYFVENAEEYAIKVRNNEIDRMTVISQDSVSLNKTNARVVLDGNYYIAGPYTINNTSNSNIAVEGKLTASNGTDIGFDLLDSQKAATTLSLTELIGQEFYLKIPSTIDIDNANFTCTLYGNNVEYWILSGDTELANNQPVGIIEPIKTELSAVLKLQQFDLALRKFITKIGDTTYNRVPVTDGTTLTSENTTFKKEHPKNALRVKTGDTVLYTIRVYNEGDLDGYATTITDYLPTGLALKANSTINTNNGWTNPSGDGKTIVTNKLANTLISAYDGTVLDYEDLQIECVVTAEDASENQNLKNIAEITAAKDILDRTNSDRDSQTNNVHSNVNNYNPVEPTKGKGEQDDDDFEDLILPAKEFDLALRKYITAVSDKNGNSKDFNTRNLNNIDISKLNTTDTTTGDFITTAEYKHQKTPVGVAEGDIVTYTLRVYNEGELDGYASEVTDYLPAQLAFIENDEINITYGWHYVNGSTRVLATNYLQKNSALSLDDTLLEAFDGTTLDYKELKIRCKVVANNNYDKIITNIAEITNFTDKNGNSVLDRDSQAKNVTLPDDAGLPDYKGNTSNKSILTDAEYHYKGQQDDDDFEKLILQEFDLALRKFITAVNDDAVTNRYPVFTTNIDANGNYIYEHTKEPVEVQSTDIVEYTIRIYNEGDIDGYAKLVKDDIPSGLEFLPNHPTNVESGYRWKMLDENGEVTDDVTKAVAIVTDYLSKEQENETGRDNLLRAFDMSSMTEPDHRDVKVAFKVIAPNTYGGIITNIAEIADDSDENGNDITDRDSTPNNDDFKEDDIDVEHIRLKYFDLALRKFITAVDDKEVTNRYPKFVITEDGKYTYEHTKEPVEVQNGNIVTYTLRIFNEGTIAGYATVVKDDIPDGLEFLPEHETNTEYRWVMLDENGEVTEDVTKAVSIATDYLSKEQEDETGRDNLLNKFNNATMDEPDYRDVKVAFKVTEPNTSDRIIINYAQISDDSDEDGNPVVDIDSTPDEWIDGEDDQDIEKIKVKYFDLALRKWVTQAIIIENGKETVKETGHKAEDDPEEVVKVEIKESQLKKVVVKFRYKIRITNEGEIAGYATEISDYIPAGLKFVAADNPKWQEVEGKIVTDQLKDTLLQPGDTAEVEVLLTWINGKDNFGLKVNVAEISKDKNDSNTPDIDSTPNNQKPGEDDIDDAPVILSIKTGIENTIQYITLTTMSLGILASGVILIRKFVL